MSAEAKLNIVPDIGSGDVSGRRPSEAIAERKSKELVIAFAGPIGSGIQAVKERITEILSASSYQVHHIKISDYLKECISKKLISVTGEPADTGAERYIQMQDAGNALRVRQADILAEYAILRVAEIRTEKIGTEADDVTDFLPERTAYLIDQLKHPEEIALLRAVYGNLFYLFGVLSVTPRRESRLRSEGVEPNKISELIERDRKQPEKNGQQLDKALQLADFFIRNDHSNAEALGSQIKRFVDLMHGANGLSPTKEEYGMYVAYAAGLRSACLSRQVGASIMNVDGTIISTGRNDVPRPGGGLYGPESGMDDARCVKLEAGVCHNDVYKRNLLKDIKAVLSEQLGQHFSELSEKEKRCVQTLSGINVEELLNKIAEKAYEETRLSGLIEFSRSIHAEMDAIVSLALKGTGSTKDGTLFTYTFPCHNCARHIVAAGIKTVYYLEPYEKSLALDLHSDAIAIDGIDAGGEAGATGDRKVRFLHFEGVAPRQYLNMFTPSGERKDKAGKAIMIKIREVEKKVPEYLDDYRQYELKVVEHLKKVIEGLEGGGLSS
ncbi:anti-phage dCTP deaminase [Candidatus Nitrotoga fabula]|uniref:Deoxycytidylate deaminase n=1 Tax=Candidatus Nitrotoga fabula TaxID=2182327 RepID=A0A916FCW2_9PROT|nr:anti-phage dCTP deaminase [Candidatus Nitrotoga fabula]CAE6741234.1 Deoxycytidylate deaminase [Candidatus Nitrotoga fabula]